MTSTITRRVNTHGICPFLILGIEKHASRLTVESAYWRLFDALEDERRFLHSPQAWVQAGLALMEVENAYQRIISGEIESDDHEEPFWPKLGQILIKAGKINLVQLHDAIAEQEIEHRPLGEILIDQGFLDQQELAAFLSSQNLITLPDDSPYLFGLRLIGLRVVPDDVVCIALIEYADHHTPIEETLLSRGWLSPEVLEAIKESD